MDILDNIANLDDDVYFLDIDGSNVVYCTVSQPKANCKHYVDLGVSPEILFNVNEEQPPVLITNHGLSDMQYSTIQMYITEENGYDQSVVPTEGSLFEYISRLKGDSQYLVIKL